VNNAKRVGTGDADPLLNGIVVKLPSDSTHAIATQAIAGNARRATPLARAIIADRKAEWSYGRRARSARRGWRVMTAHSNNSQQKKCPAEAGQIESVERWKA
jgi:hypothetical protein